LLPTNIPVGGCSSSVGGGGSSSVSSGINQQPKLFSLASLSRETNKSEYFTSGG